MRPAIVNKDNVVVNIIIWEGAEFLPPRDHLVVRSDACDIGDLYDEDKNIFVKPAINEE